MQRVFFLNAFLILVIVSSSVFTQSDRRLIQRRRDAINNWIRRIRSSKRGYSLSPSWNGKSPYQVPSVANLPLQSEPEDNNIRNTLPVRRFKRKRVQDTVIAPKFPPNYDELNFDGFDQALELTDFEGNPLKTADFHPDVDDESPPSHKDPYASFDTGFLGDFKEEYQFPTAPPATEKPTESPPLAKYPYRNHQEIVLSEELNKVPRRPIYNSPITSTNSNNNDFKPSYPYKYNNQEHSYPYPSYPQYDQPRTTPPPRHHYRYKPSVNYRAPIGQFEQHNSGVYRGGASPSSYSGSSNSFFDTFDAFGPTGERRVFNTYRKYKKSQDLNSYNDRPRKNSFRRRFKPKKINEEELISNFQSDSRVPILTPKEKPFYPTISTTTTRSTTTTTASTTTSTTTRTPYKRESTTSRPIPTPGPFDFPRPPPSSQRQNPRHPTHPPMITHPPHHGRRNKGYSYPHESFTDFDSFDTRFESMKIRNKRNADNYEHEYVGGYDEERLQPESRFGRIGSNFWSDANIEYDYFDKPSTTNDEVEEEELNYEVQGENSYRKQHSVYPKSNFAYTKNNYKKNNNYNSYNQYFSQNDLPSSKNKEILGSGNFDVLTGGIFNEGTTRRSYTGSSFSRNYSKSNSNSPFSLRSNRRQNQDNPFEEYDIDPAIRFANFKDFASIKRRRN